MSEALFLLCLISSSLQVTRPPAHATAPRPCTATASLTKGLRVVRMFGQSRLFDGECQQIATTATVPFNTGLWLLLSQAFSGWFDGSRQTVKSRSFRPDGMVRTFRR